MGAFEEQLQKMRTHPGFIAALDHSGGSTPNALGAYGIKDDAWSSEAEMFAIVHQMRARIITSPCFTGERMGTRRAFDLPVLCCNVTIAAIAIAMMNLLPQSLWAVRVLTQDVCQVEEPAATDPPR